MIVKPSTADGEEYGSATWTGISGDHFYRNGAGADFTTVSPQWLETNIRAKGPMGARYPRHLSIVEGDTPSILGLIPNGLQTLDQPNWGDWGGRYILRQPCGETRPIWTQGGDACLRVTSANDLDRHVSDRRPSGAGALRFIGRGHGRIGDGQRIQTVHHGRRFGGGRCHDGDATDQCDRRAGGGDSINRDDPVRGRLS